jgi:hypothetical protein
MRETALATMGPQILILAGFLTIRLNAGEEEAKSGDPFFADKP